jgi:hypothetical protein
VNSSVVVPEAIAIIQPRPIQQKGRAAAASRRLLEAPTADNHTTADGTTTRLQFRSHAFYGGPPVDVDTLPEFPKSQTSLRLFFRGGVTHGHMCRRKQTISRAATAAAGCAARGSLRLSMID